MSHSSPLEKVVNDVKVLIFELKKEYFQQKEPLSDDEPLVHKLCVRLENVLRFGAREKYTFMGIRKDYWNFISESIPKDENVKHVQSIPDFRTNPGKGRAFLREALMQKSLADTFQRVIINERITKDYYGVDSVMRNVVHFQSLIHTLYDLNAVEFDLPHHGHDLDKGFPSFARKRFDSGSVSSRRSSVSSVQSFQPDPLQNLRTNINLIELVINAWLGKITENTENNDNEVSLLQFIDKLALLREHIVFLKAKCCNEVEGLKTEIEKLKDEKLKSEAYMEQRINLLHDQYKSKISIDSTTADDNLKKVSEKLTYTEQTLLDMKEEHENDISNLKNLLNVSQEEHVLTKNENNELSETLEQLQYELVTAKETNVSYSSTNKILEGKLSELQKINTTLKSSEKEMTQKNCEIEQLLKIKETELNVLQDAFQKSTGHVVCSVEELKTQLSSQQDKTSEVLSSVCSTNEELLNESKTLLNENNQLQFKIDVLEEKLLQETNKKEETEKIVADLKCKCTEDMKHLCELQTFISDVWNVLNNVSEELDDVEGDGLMTKQVKYNKEAAIQKILLIQQNVEAGEKAKKEADMEIDKLSRELAHQMEALNMLKEELNNVSAPENKYTELQEHNAKLNSDIEIFNGKIYDMSVDIINLNESLAKKQGDLERERNIISTQEDEIELLKTGMADLEKELASTYEKNEVIINDLSDELEKLKGKQDTEYDSWASEKDSLIAQCKELNEKVDEISKEKEEEKVLHKNATVEIDTLMEECKIKEEKYMSEINQNKQDVEDIKILLVTSTREKHELWEKKELLEQELAELKEQLSDRWVNDSDVTKCSSCEGQFTLTRRKHHCRICGQIFCNDCSNRWIKNNQRRKKVRACHNCANAHEASAKPSSSDSPIGAEKNTRDSSIGAEKSDVGSPIDTISSFNSTSDTTSILGCDEEIHDADGQVHDSGNDEVFRDVTSENVDGTNNACVSFEIPDDQPANMQTTYEETATGDFEILAAEDVSNSGAFGSNQEVKILSSDLMKSCLIPNCHTDIETPAEMETVDIDVAAGYRVILPVLVPGVKMDLSWEFISSPKDVGFGVAFKPYEEEGDELLETIVPLARYISHKLTIHGKMTIGNPGTYYLVFDNSYSRLTMKTVKCKIGLMKSRTTISSNQE